MPTVKAEVAGKVLTLLGYDGTDFYNVLVDAAGHVQIDVIGSALPAGAATEATLATLATEAKLELCRLLLVGLQTELELKADLTETQPVSAAALPLPAGASTSADQALLLTELQLKADLTETQPVLDAAIVALLAGGLPVALHLGSLKMREQNPIAGYATEGTLATVNTTVAGRLKPADLNIEAVSKDLQVDVKSSALPSGAAISGHQITTHDRLQRQLGYYLGQIMQGNANANAAAGTNLLTGAGPAAGEVWVITGMTAYNDNNPVTGIFMGVFNGANYHWVNSCGAAGADEMLSWGGEIVLVNGDTPRCYIMGCTLNDDIYFFVYGYKRET